MFLGIIAVFASVATYVFLTGTFGAPVISLEARIGLLLFDVAVLSALVALIGARLARLISARRRGAAGSRLQARLVMLFSVIAVLPAVAVLVTSLWILNFQVDATFSSTVRSALSRSLTVAEAYLEEHKKSIRADALAMAADMNVLPMRALTDPNVLAEFLTAQSDVRTLSEAMIVDRHGQVIARSEFTFTQGALAVSPFLLQRGWTGDALVITGERDDRVRAVIKLSDLVGGFLVVGRFVDPTVLGHIQQTRASVTSYEELADQRQRFEITFAMIHGLVVLIFILVAILAGMAVAARIGGPIAKLISAADKVRGGDLDARVPDPGGADELSSLSRAFNRMTRQLQTQQKDLLEANQQLDERRRFTEAVLGGVSAGVIGLDADGRINLPNRVASELLGIDLDSLVGRQLARAVPEMKGLVTEARRKPERVLERQIDLRREGRTHTLLVRVMAEVVPGDDGQVSGFVVTFDDVTDLLSAQRVAAWADVARRLAHEIKNPLTPIQLSAERLKRKYRRQIESDVDIFNTCTDTIVRHVDDIKRMVDEFSAFARMPSAVMKPENITELAMQAVFLQRAAHPDVTFDTDVPEQHLYMPCDGGKIRQVLTNLLQNALEAVSARAEPTNGSELPPGHVQLAMVAGEKTTTITVEDNGVGLPAEGRERLMEPYVTTREKGTGLGLAVVRKIMEEHDGTVSLEDADSGGARVVLSFDRTAEPRRAPEEAAE